MLNLQVVASKYPCDGGDRKDERKNHLEAHITHRHLLIAYTSRPFSFQGARRSTEIPVVKAEGRHEQHLRVYKSAQLYQRDTEVRPHHGR